MRHFTISVPHGYINKYSGETPLHAARKAFIHIADISEDSDHSFRCEFSIREIAVTYDDLDVETWTNIGDEVFHYTGERIPRSELKTVFHYGKEYKVLYADRVTTSLPTQILSDR